MPFTPQFMVPIWILHSSKKAGNDICYNRVLLTLHTFDISLMSNLLSDTTEQKIVYRELVNSEAGSTENSAYASTEYT